MTIHHPWDDAPPDGGAAEVAPGVLWLRLPLPLRLNHVNAYALRDADGWTVIDTGFDGAATRAAWEALLAGPMAGSPVTRLIVTHHHPDHIGLAGWFVARGAEMWTSRASFLTGRMLWLDPHDRPPPEQIDFLRRAGMPAGQLAVKACERPWNMSDVVHPLPQGYRRLTEGQVVRFGDRYWRVALGEGHAPEMVTLWSQDDDLVIGGDQLLPGISPNLGVYPSEPDANPVQDWLDSCARLAALAEPRHLVLPGHKLPFRGLPARLAAMTENHESALTRLAEELGRAPRTAVDCFDLLFKRRIGDGEFGLAVVEAVAHINCLAHRGLIAPVGVTNDGGTLWGA